MNSKDQFGCAVANDGAALRKSDPLIPSLGYGDTWEINKNVSYLYILGPLYTIKKDIVHFPFLSLSGIKKIKTQQAIHLTIINLLLHEYHLI